MRVKDSGTGTHGKHGSKSGQKIEEAVYSCEKGKGRSSCDFFIWVEEAQMAEAAKGYSVDGGKARVLRGTEIAVAAVAAVTTPKPLKQSLLPWHTPPSKDTVSSRTRSSTCYATTAATSVSPPKALAPPHSPSPATGKRRRGSSPSSEVSEQKPSPHKQRRPNRVTKNPYSTNHPSRTSTPKPPPSSTLSSRKAAAVTTGTWDRRSIVPPPSETDADESSSDNDATVTLPFSPNHPRPRRRLFNSNCRPTTPPRTTNTRAASRTPGSRTGSFYSGVLSSPARGVQLDVRMAVFELVHAEGIDLKGTGDRLWDILEREVKQKEGVCKGREIARTAHRRAMDMITGLNRRIAELEKERDEAKAANVKSKVAIEELETRLDNADLESRASSYWC
ncbi:unnamed protein product [Tuber aestivum]|uniref:Uncharacterized protein n=1 Tax=Tuber aestivum TaxID=59557 RepID=A0A292Q210_9PEZI|nr:unnamed protein product [Tuber aestivum]